MIAHRDQFEGGTPYDVMYHFGSRSEHLIIYQRVAAGGCRECALTFQFQLTEDVLPTIIHPSMYFIS
jgi:hypothetical protein